jgi:hypothetical protein
MKSGELNVGEVIGNQDVDVKISTREHPDERAARIIREEAESAHQRQKDFYLFIVTIVRTVFDKRS